MAWPYPWVADGENGLQIWTTANILNKKSVTANKGWSANFRVGQGPKNCSQYRIVS